METPCLGDDDDDGLPASLEKSNFLNGDEINFSLSAKLDGKRGIMARGCCLCCMLIAMKKGELDHLTRLECGREEEKCCEVILVTSQVGQAVFLASPKILKEGQAVFWFLLRLFQAGDEKFFWASPKIL